MPVMQVILLLSLSTGSLLIGRLKLALLINYCFTLYSGYFANIDIFNASEVMNLNSYTSLYFGFGFMIVLLAMVGFIMNRD